MSLAEFDELKWDHSCDRLDVPSNYLKRKARKTPSGLEELRKSMVSATIYVGNLSFYTSEEQLYELFSKCGTIEKIIMGLDRFKFTPCGFCFIIYQTPEEALAALKYLSKTKLDDREISIDLDPGFEEGRQFGRGKNGGQVSDELRFEYDASRGGFYVPLENRIGSVNNFGARRIRESDKQHHGHGHHTHNAHNHNSHQHQPLSANINPMEMEEELDSYIPGQ